MRALIQAFLAEIAWALTVTVLIGANDRVGCLRNGERPLAGEPRLG